MQEQGGYRNTLKAVSVTRLKSESHFKKGSVSAVVHSSCNWSTQPSSQTPPLSMEGLEEKERETKGQVREGLTHNLSEEETNPSDTPTEDYSEMIDIDALQDDVTCVEGGNSPIAAFTIEKDAEVSVDVSKEVLHVTIGHEDDLNTVASCEHPQSAEISISKHDGGVHPLSSPPETR